MGATEDTFAALARADRIDFSRGVSPPWLTNAGHLRVAVAGHLDESRAAAIRSIYLVLGGDETLLAGKRSGSDPRLDFLLEANGLAVEVDEIQHFTTDRLRTLDLYPPNAENLLRHQHLPGAYRAVERDGRPIPSLETDCGLPVRWRPARPTRLFRCFPRPSSAELRAALVARPCAGVRRAARLSAIQGGHGRAQFASEESDAGLTVCCVLDLSTRERLATCARERAGRVGRQPAWVSLILRTRVAQAWTFPLGYIGRA